MGDTGVFLRPGGYDDSSSRGGADNLDWWGLAAVSGGPCGEVGELGLGELAAGMAHTVGSVTFYLHMLAQT